MGLGMLLRLTLWGTAQNSNCTTFSRDVVEGDLLQLCACVCVYVCINFPVYVCSTFTSLCTCMSVYIVHFFASVYVCIYVLVFLCVYVLLYVTFVSIYA